MDSRILGHVRQAQERFGDQAALHLAALAILASRHLAVLQELVGVDHPRSQEAHAFLTDLEATHAALVSLDKQ